MLIPLRDHQETLKLQKKINATYMPIVRFKIHECMYNRTIPY